MNQTKIHNHDARALANYRKGNLLILLATAAVIFVSAKSLRAATLYWDGNGSTAGVGGTGTWSGANFSSSSAGGGTLVRATTADTVNFDAAAGGASGTLITLPTATWTSTNLGTVNFNSSYSLTTSGSSSTTLNVNSINIAANQTLTLTNSQTVAFAANTGTATFSGAGASSVLQMAQITTSSTDFKRISLNNINLTNLSINMTGTGAGGYKGFVVASGSSSIGANITNNTTDALVLGANSSATLNLYGVISGSGRVALSSGQTGGAGTLNLYSENTYTGVTEFNGGTNMIVRLQTNNAISTVSSLQHGTIAGAFGGNLELNGFNQTLAGISSGNGSGSGRITNSAVGLSTLTINQAANSTYGFTTNGTATSGAGIGGNIALVKTNTGNLTLTGSNNYSGGTTVNGGTLTASNASALGSGSVTVGSGGTLSVLANLTNTVANSGTVSIGSGGTLTAASLGTGALSLAGVSGTNASFVSTQSGSTLSVGAVTLGGYSSYSMASDKSLSSSGAITLSGTGNTITLTGTALGVGTYNLFTGTSISKGSLSAGGLKLGGAGISNLSLDLDGSQTLVGRTTYDFTSTATALQLVVGGGGAFNVVWNGGDGAWDTSTSNWQKDGAGSNITFVANDNVTLSTGNTVTVDGAGMTAGTLAANNSSGTATLAGGNVTATSLSKSGAGALVVSNAITAISGVTQSAGTLTTAGNLTISNTGVNISGGTANLNGSNSIVSGGLTVSGGTAVLNGSNTISAGGLNVSSGSLTVNSTNAITGGLNVTGGTATINSSSNSITGGVNANGGVLIVNANGALGNNSISLNGGSLGGGTLGTVTNAIAVGVSGGTVTNSSDFAISGPISGGGNTLTKTGNGNLNIAGGFATNGTGGSMSLNVQSGSVTLSGAGTKWLTNSTFNGDLVLSNATMSVRLATFGGTGQVKIAGNSTWANSSSANYVTNTVTLLSGSTLNLSNSVNLNLLGGLTGTGDVNMTTGSGNLYITGSTFNGAFTNNGTGEVRFYESDVSGITSYGGSATTQMMFSNSANRTVGGRITGGQGLAIRGSAVTTFTNLQNDFTGAINLAASAVGATAKFIGTGSMGSTSGGAISLGSSNGVANTLWLDGVSSGRTISFLSGGGTVYVAGDSTLGAVTNNTSGGQLFVKDGSGNLTFNGLVRDGASADAPVLKIAAGKVTLNASTSSSQYLGINTNAVDYYVGDLALSAGNQVSMHGSGTMGGGGKILLNGNDAAIQTSSSSSNDGANLTIANDIVMNGGSGTKASFAATTSNSLALNRVLGSGDLYFGTQGGGGAGVTSLNNTLSLTGNVYMNLSTNGTLRFAAANLLGNNQGIIMYRTNSNADITASGTMDLNGNNQTAAFIQSLSNNSAYTGVIQSASAATLTLNQSSDTTYGGSLGGALALVKNNGGILNLASSNSMTGGVTLNDGAIYLGSSYALGSGKLTFNGGRLASYGSARTLANAIDLYGDVTLGRVDYANGNSLTVNGAIDLQGGTRTITLDNSFTAGGVISNGALVIDDRALGRNFTVTGASTYAGGTTVRGGSLRLSGAGSLNSTGALSLAATNASFDISGLTGSGTTIGSLAGVANSSVALGSKNLAVGGNNSTTSYAGAISGTGGSVTKNGSGKFTLSGSNSYDGATTVNSGTLEVASGGSISSSTSSVNDGGTLTVNGSAGNVTVNSGGALKGSGSVDALTIASGGILAVGNSPGTLNASSAIWNGGGTYSWELASALGNDTNPLTGQGTNWDFLNVTGVLDIAASSGSEFIIDIVSLLALNDTSFNQDNNYSFAIATATGGISNFDVSDFSITGFLVGSNKWSVGLVNNTGSSQTLLLSYTGATAIPEPATGSLLLVGLLGALAARRRRRS